MRRIHVYLDNARYHHGRAVQAWMKQPGRRIVLHFIPLYCPHLNPIERLWAVMHQNVTHNHYYPTFKDFADAVLTFLTQTVPKHFDRFSDRITDNCDVQNLMAPGGGWRDPAGSAGIGRHLKGLSNLAAAEADRRPQEPMTLPSGSCRGPVQGSGGHHRVRAAPNCKPAGTRRSTGFHRPFRCFGPRGWLGKNREL